MTATNLLGKTALVCGASQGIGHAIARALAKDGCRIIALARSETKLQSLMDELPGKDHRMMVADLMDLEAIAAAIEEHQKSGPIHILINNTGGPAPGPILEAGEDTFISAFQQHILAANTLVKELIEGMKASGYGRIINIISTSVKVPIANLGVSNTIRGAMANWAKTLSQEAGPFGITVNNILPGFTKTPRLANLLTNTSKKLGKSEDEVRQTWYQTIPARRFAEPEEVAAAAAFLASPAAGYINGINLPVDGGRTGCL